MCCLLHPIPENCCLCILTSVLHDKGRRVNLGPVTPLWPEVEVSPKQFYQFLFINRSLGEIGWVGFFFNPFIVSGISKCILPSLFNDNLAGNKILGLQGSVLSVLLSFHS